MKYPKNHTAAAVIFMLLLSVEAACAGEFIFKKTGSGYYPESYDPVITLPGRDMKAGIFEYLYDDGRDGTKAAIMVNNEVIYYVNSPDRENGEYDPGGDTNYGIYKDYFLLDSFAHGASHRRMMYLFKTSKDNTVKLLDVLVEANVAENVPYLLDFMSESIEEKKPGWDRMYYRLPVWTDIKDIDGDGRPEIKLRILTGNADLTKEFALYLEISGERLRVDFNPALYKPLFEEEKSKSRKSFAYYIYGFFSGKLKLEKIKRDLRGDRELYKSVVPLLENRDRWNSAFHEYDGRKPVLMKYDIKR